MKPLLFTAEFDAEDESCVNLPGFSHWGQPRKKYTKMIRTVYFFAKHRRQAGQHLTRFCGINTPCNLSEGKKSSLCTPTMIERLNTEDH